MTAKKPKVGDAPLTLHPMQMANSLTLQNGAMLRLISTIQSCVAIAREFSNDPARMKKLIDQIANEAEKTEKVIWP